MHLLVHIAVQYAAITAEMPENINGMGIGEKMRQILTDALNHEIIMNKVPDDQLFFSATLLADKMLGYISSHMELVWDTKIHSVVIAGYRYSDKEW
jgi:hypothetical protein